MLHLAKAALGLIWLTLGTFSPANCPSTGAGCYGDMPPDPPSKN